MDAGKTSREGNGYMAGICVWMDLGCSSLSPFPSFDAREALGTSFPRESLSVSSEQAPGPACREDIFGIASTRFVALVYR